MKIRQLEAFKSVMTAGTVTAAADLMNISQPVVSRLIAQLESATGLKLFFRSKRRLRPTPEALSFFREVEKTFAGVEKLKQVASNIRNFSTGNLRIVCLPALALGFVPRVIDRFLDKHPKITVSLQTRSSQTVREWIAAQQFDLGLAAGATNIPGVTSEVFAEVNGVCVLPKRHRLVRKRFITAQDLKDEQFISLGLEDPSRLRVDRVFEAARIPRRLFIETQFAATICGFVQLNRGLSIINPFTADDFNGQGIAVRPFRPSIPFSYNLHYPAHRLQTAVTVEFIAMMKAHRDEILRKYQR